MSTASDDTPEPRPGLRSLNPCGPVVEVVTAAGSREIAVLVYRSTAADQALCATPDEDPSPRLYGLALRLPGTPADLIPDFTLEVWRTSAVFDADRDNAMAWIMAIAYRRAVDRLRSSHHPAHHPPPALSISPLGRRAARNARRVDRATSTEAHRVRDAFAQLAPRQREALEVVYLDEDTTAEPRDLTVILTNLVSTSMQTD